jgi:small subunit ribosomal protein S5
MRDKNFRPRRPEEPKEYEQRILDLARVARVTKGGKRFKFRATVVIGNRKGKVGIGVAKGPDVAGSVDKAVNQAKKHLKTISLVYGTIAHQVEIKYGTAKILLRPGALGRGIVAGGAVRVVCELAGIENIVGKILGRSRNKINNARATLMALESLKRSSQASENLDSKKEESKEGVKK